MEGTQRRATGKSRGPIPFLGGLIPATTHSVDPEIVGAYFGKKNSHKRYLRLHHLGKFKKIYKPTRKKY